MRQLFIIIVAALLSSCHSAPRYTQSSPAHRTINPASSSMSLVAFDRGKSLSTVLDRAERLNKLVFVDIYADWCAPCKLMDQEVFNDPEIARLLNDHFISYKVNGEQGNGPDLAMIFGVKSYPTLLFLDEAGTLIVRKDGAAMQSELSGLARYALRQTSRYSGLED